MKNQATSTAHEKTLWQTCEIIQLSRTDSNRVGAVMKWGEPVTIILTLAIRRR